MAEIITIPCGNVNCFLIKNKGSAVLVDTGLQEKSVEKIYDVCKDSNVRCIILTHGHIDHIRNAAYLSEKLNAPIGLGIGDKELINDNTLQTMNGRGFRGKILAYFSVKSIKFNLVKRFEPSIFFKEGDSLSQFGIDGRIVELPGHTKGSIGIDIEERDFIAGDALMNMFKPEISLIYENKRQLEESAEKISRLGCRTIYFGHGKSVLNKKWV